MKTVSLSVVLILFVGVSACSQNDNRGGNGANRRNIDPLEQAELQTKNMTEALELSEEKSEQIRQISISFAEKQKELRDNSSGDRESMRKSMSLLNNERDEEYKKVLSDEEWKKWMEIRSSRRERGRRGA